LVAVGLLGSAHPSFSLEKGQERRPNLVLIITDDHSYGDVSTYHESDVKTPHIH
jgi:hypothetical protein